MADVHTDFWVVVATIAPIAIAINIVIFSQAVSKRELLHRDGDRGFTARLRSLHLMFVVLNLLACLALILLSLISLWRTTDEVNGWVAITLLLAMLVELFAVAICSDSLAARAERRDGARS
jgi:hypothetical protein